MNPTSIAPECPLEPLAAYDPSEGAIRRAIDAFCNGVMQDTHHRASDALRQAKQYQPLLP